MPKIVLYLLILIKSYKNDKFDVRIKFCDIYAKCGIGKLIKRWLGVEHDIVLFSSVGEAVKSAKMYYWS